MTASVKSYQVLEIAENPGFEFPNAELNFKSKLLLFLSLDLISLSNCLTLLGYLVLFSILLILSAVLSSVKIFVSNHNKKKI